MKFNHIGIFSRNITKGESTLGNIFKVKKASKIFYDKKMSVKVKFLYDYKNICYEIVSPYGKVNPVKKVLEKSNNILNHVAYTTKNFDKKIIELRKKGFAPIINPIKSKAFGGKKVCFFLTPLNFIIEVIENE